GALGQGPGGSRTARPGLELGWTESRSKSGAEAEPQTTVDPGPEMGTGSQPRDRGAPWSPKEALDSGCRHKDGIALGSGWGLPFSSGPPCRACSPTCEAPAANTHRPPSVALAIPLRAGGRLTPAFRTSQKRGCGLGPVVRRTNCSARRGPHEGAGWGDRRLRRLPGDGRDPVGLPLGGALRRLPPRPLSSGAG
ncbi:hypothetical protein E2I00_019634, partial [Balaenoptera physalus]